MVEGYRFDPKFDWWTQDHQSNYELIKDHLMYRNRRTQPIRFLEIGVFEGRPTIWFVENILRYYPGSTYVCVEPDPAPNFEHNMTLLRQRAPNVSIEHHRLYSEEYLPKMICSIRSSESPGFDAAYIDGDHNAPGVLRDGVMVWECLKEGGVELFDDYEMEATDPWHYISHGEFKQYPRANFKHPCCAIDAFLNVYRGLYDRFIDNFQVGVIKRIYLGAKNLYHGDNTQGDFEYHAMR